MSIKKVDVLGIPFINMTRQQFVELLHKYINNNKKTFIVTANPEIVIKAHQDKDYNNAIRRADYITADGIGVVKAAKLLNRPLPERLTGYELLVDLLNVADDHSYSIYLLGATEETLQKATSNIQQTYPNIKLVGAHHGFFDWSSNHIQDEIAAKTPDLIFVALGAPRQEMWIAENIDKFHKGIFIGVGGSLDVLAGTVKRAPLIWQKANLEWLYRMLKQPSRFKRSLALPKFAIKVFKQKVKGL